MQLVHQLHQILKPFMLRRTKDQFVEKLPEKIEINLEVGLSKLQIDMYAAILCGQEGLGNMAYNTNLLQTFNPRKLKNLLMQLRKVCNHPYLFEGAEPVGSEIFGEHLVEVSGKLRMVD